MAASDFILPAIALFLLLGRRKAGAGGGGGGGGFLNGGVIPTPSAAAIAGSAGPEVFAGVDPGLAYGAIGGRSYRDKPEGWSLLDWEDFLTGN